MTATQSRRGFSIVSFSPATSDRAGTVIAGTTQTTTAMFQPDCLVPKLRESASKSTNAEALVVRIAGAASTWPL
jgi:hypothetical protein